MTTQINKFDVSLIIVNWNTKQLLLECIESLIHETHRCSIEIIVVDNGSTDGSAQAVQERFPDVKLILNDKNLGFAKANNIGIKLSSGRYVCLVNSDIKALDACIDRMHDYMNNNPTIGALGPKTLGGDLKFRLNCRDFPDLWKSFCESLMLNKIFTRSKFLRGRLITDIDQNAAQSVDVLSGCFLMIRREVIEQVGMLDEKFYIYAEDCDWCKRIHSAGWDVVFYPGAQAIHYGGVSSAAAPVKFQIEMLKSDFIYWEKHHSWIGQKTYFMIKVFHYLIRIVGLSIKSFIKTSTQKSTLLQLKNSAVCLKWTISHQLNVQSETD